MTDDRYYTWKQDLLREPLAVALFIPACLLIAVSLPLLAVYYFVCLLIGVDPLRRGPLPSAPSQPSQSSSAPL
jgi:hypothetical protein